MERAKHAYGSRANLDSAIASGKVDAFDILLLSGENETPAMGWVDSKTGKPIIIEQTDLSGVEAELATKADATEVEEKLSAKADAEKVEALEIELATKVTAEEVEAKVTAKIDEVETKVGKYTSRMYEIAKAPDGTLVDYFDKEIRVMVPNETDFANFNNGIAGVESMRYIEFRIYVPEGVVKYKSDLGGMVMAGKVEDFARFTDEYGRVYIMTFPSIAHYDEATAAWVYDGVNSTTKHYVGWNHTVEWFDENGVVIASDSVRINLSNEECHSAIKPYYGASETEEIETKIDEAVEEKVTVKVEEAVTTANAYTDAQIEAKLAEVESAYEIIEF